MSWLAVKILSIVWTKSDCETEAAGDREYIILSVITLLYLILFLDNSFVKQGFIFWFNINEWNLLQLFRLNVLFGLNVLKSASQQL